MSASLDLGLTPGGAVTIRDDGADGGSGGDWQQAVRAALGRSWPEGLLVLGGMGPPSGAHASVAFWQAFAGRYVTRLCHIPESMDLAGDSISAPAEGELASVVLSAPPMVGAEYLTIDMLRDIWGKLDAEARRLAARAGGLAALLAEIAPAYSRVGRVWFHLAENRADEACPFAFLATYASGLSRGGKVRQLPLGRALREYAGARNKPAMVKLLSPVHAAAGQSALIAELVDRGDIFHPLAWSPQEAYRFLQDVPICEASGVLVRIPDWWKKRARPQVAVTIGEKKRRFLGQDALLDFRVDLALGGRALSPEEAEELLSGAEGLVRLHGRWVEVDRQKLEEALEHWRTVETSARNGEMSFAEGMRLLAGAPRDLGADEGLDGAREWAFVQAGSWLKDTLAGLREPAALAAGGADAAFRGTLRPYQRNGTDWLWFSTQLGLGACLADDMGLGKTVQVLALLLRRRRGECGRASLLIVPASLLANWQAEAERFAPSLRLLPAHPSQMPREEWEALAESPAARLAGADVVMTTYSMAARQEWLAEADWDLLVLDEAQAIKNPSAKQTRAVKRIKARARIALTGTPIENRLGDLWSLFDFLNPGLLGSAKRFQRFVRALERREPRGFAPLRKLVSPYILRRLKTDRNIIADLPEKTEMTVHCGLSKPQAGLYARTVKELQSRLATSAGIQRRGLVLAYLMQFKQICNHPSQFLGDGDYGPGDSGKFQRLGELCEEIAARQEKALVFTQFREMTEPLARHLAGIFGREGLVLHGGTRVKGRQALVDAFQREDGPPFFVLSIKAEAERARPQVRHFGHDRGTDRRDDLRETGPRRGHPGRRRREGHDGNERRATPPHGVAGH
jgi:non-specific serine/threonine protein kinase